MRLCKLSYPSLYYKVGLMVCAPMLIMIGVEIYAGFVGHDAEQRRAATKYLQTEGTVVENLVQQHSYPRRYGEWRVRYQYRVEGASYTSTRYAYVPLSVSREEKVLHFSTGSTVAVFYDPENPQNSVLNNSLPDHWAGRIISFGFALYAAFIGFRAMGTREFAYVAMLDREQRVAEKSDRDRRRDANDNEKLEPATKPKSWIRRRGSRHDAASKLPPPKQRR